MPRRPYHPAWSAFVKRERAIAMNIGMQDEWSGIGAVASRNEKRAPIRHRGGSFSSLFLGPIAIVSINR
jgi:hypothetical protein